MSSFGLGSLVVSALKAGAARATAADCVAFILDGDHLPLVLVDAESNTKKIQCIGQIACAAAASHGITEFSVVDHDTADLQATVFWLSF